MHRFSMMSCILLVAAMAHFTQAVQRAQTAPPRPNIVYIMADDLGYGDIKSFGGERCQIDTPNFDALAAQGMRFTDAHANASVCVPTRVAVMTGRYPWRFGKTGPGGPWGFLGTRIPVEHFTLGKMLKAAGYRTGYVGKWHLGTLMPTTDGKNQGPTNVDYTKPMKIGPPQYGFDYSFILPGSLDMYPYVFVRDNQFVGKVTAQRGWSAFNRVGPAASDFEDFKVLDSFSTEAEQFIGRNAKAARDGKPFFLYFALTAPHTPTSPSPAFKGKSKLGLYGDFVSEADDCVGRVVAALKANGLDKNTLVIATSDHGPGVYAGNTAKATINNLRQLETKGHYSAGIYRDYKFSVYEGGLRIPFVAKWPGVVKAGSTCDRLIGLNDLCATLGDVTGQKLTGDEAPDSISYLPLLRDSQAAGPRQTMILQGTHAFVVRHKQWKLALAPGCGGMDIWGNEPKREPAWRAALKEFGKTPKLADLYKAPFVQLFELNKDPREQKNLAGANPKVIEQLVALLNDQIAQGRSTPGPKLLNNRTVKPFARVPGFVLPKGKPKPKPKPRDKPKT